MFTKTLAAALFAALPAAVTAVGNAIVQNECYHTVYLWSVDNNSIGDRHTIAPGTTYAETYRTPQSGGISIKMSKNDTLYPGPDGRVPIITQFEYTLTDMIWYDISNINGNPFKAWGLQLFSSDSSCPTKTCIAGEDKCKEAYNEPDDNSAVGACSAESDTTFILCADRHGQIKRDEKRDEMHKRAAHRHHFHRHAAAEE